MRTCPKCGRTSEDTASFCTFCGTKLQVTASGPAFCTSCGAPLEPGAKFCTSCGARVISFEAPPKQLTEQSPAAAPTIPASDGPAPEQPKSPLPEPAEPVPADRNASDPAPQADPDEITASAPETAAPDKPAPDKPGKKKLLLLLLPLLALLLGGGFFGWRWYSNQALARELMSDAEQYMEDGKFVLARDKFLELTKLQPNNAGARLGLARAYLHQGKFDDAAECLEDLSVSEGGENYEAWRRLLGIAQFKPVLDEVNTENFPRVELVLRGGGSLQPSEKEIALEEDGVSYAPSEYIPGEGVFTLAYTAPDTEISGEPRNVSVSLNLDDIVFTLGESYTTPYFEQAQVRLVSADVSAYPSVTAYFRVEDFFTGAPIEGLNAAAFRISERLQGGQYLSREVHTAKQLEGNHGLSIDLVADKSGSISDSDMQKIKRVMTDFVSSLHYEDGDKAEILAFDSIVQQMCCYTSNQALLANGIQNMSTDGLTALYDAIHDGVHNAALQGGARCVIAFTDGMDNESHYTPGEIIQYANISQVPVYIIGVGWSVETYTLRNVAEGTGGRYWFIDDLYDLQEIFNEIYAEQKKLYAVEYVSDGSAGAYDVRELDVSVNGGGYRGREETSFQASRSVSGVTHTSRYELVKEALSWEDAAKRCQEMGGHLATITSQREMDEIVGMAEANNLRFIWLGGYTSYNSAGNVFGHWVTGEEFSFQAWSPGEPSRVDLDGVDEWYIMLWNVQSLGGWTWNDQRNDPAAAVPSMAADMGFICEYES